MKLAEALTLRADTQKRIEQVKARMLRNARVQEGERPAEDPNVLLSEYDTLSAELVQLIRRINVTNAAASVAGLSMTEALATREVLKHRHAAHRDLAEAASAPQFAVTRSEIRVKAAVSVRDIQSRADQIARDLRELDARIQEANWQLELHD
ncbi:MAG: DIP1984 family protein [Nitrospira sp.]|nr:DIP1984 family protein [Nitrospira sp.]